MKYIIPILILLFSHNASFSQRNAYLRQGATVSEAKAFFQKNSDILDPIEGIYDVQYTPYYSGGNYLSGLRQWGGNELGTTACIYKLPDGTYQCNTLISEGDVNIRIKWGWDWFKLERLGSSDTYRLTGGYNERYSHFGNSGWCKFDISTRIRYNPNGTFEYGFSGNDQFHRVEADVSFIKTYPNH